MISYIIQLSIYWAIGYLLYLAVFHQWTLFRWNRWYLLSILLGGAVLPLCSLPEATTNITGEHLLPEVLVTFSGEINALDQTIRADASPNWPVWIYIAGLLFFMGRTAYSLWAIRGLFKNSIHSNEGDYTIVHTSNDHPPFAFGRWIFINHAINLNNRLHRIILKHEQAHIKAGHTIDILITELMGWIFWFHPLMYAYRYALRLNHEFSADAEVLEDYSKLSYGRALLEFHREQPEWHLTRSFHFSKLKKRFIMMDTQTTHRNKRWSYLAILPIFLIAFFTLEMNEVHANWMDDRTENVQGIQDTLPGDQVYRVAEVMPLFPGCEDIEDREKRSSCSNQKMMEFIYDKVNYPEEARKNKVEGTVPVSFVVGADGFVRDVKIVNKPNKFLGEEALRAVRSMQSENIQWTPGRQSGEEVAVRYTLPIRFQLPEQEETDQSEHTTGLIQQIAPNPSDGTVTITLSGKDAPAKFIIKNKQGAIIKRQNIRSLAPEHIIQLNLDEKGTYWFQVSQGEESNAQQFVIQ